MLERYRRAGRGAAERRSLRAFSRVVWCSVLAVLGPLAAAAQDGHDIYFLTEHAAESGMDANYLALPWPGDRLDEHRWLWSADLAFVHTETDFIRLDGPTVAGGAFKRVAERWGYGLLGFYGDQRVSGDPGRVELTAGLLHGVPLDLPQPAEFTNARGSIRDLGVGALAVHELPSRRAAVSNQITSGGLIEQLDLDGYRFDYRLGAEPDSTSSGVLDHSLSASFVTLLVGWQQIRPLAELWTWSPRALLAYPLPPADFKVRLTGPGFERQSPADGPGFEIGDPFIALGLALAHRPSGLEIDIGETLLFPALEHQSHPGVGRVWLIHFAWRQRGRR